MEYAKIKGGDLPPLKIPDFFGQEFMNQHSLHPASSYNKMELANLNDVFNFNGSPLNFFIKVNETNPLMKYWIIANEVAGDILHYRAPRNAIDKFCPNKISYGDAIARGWIFQGPRFEDPQNQVHRFDAPQIRDPQTLIIPISDVARLISNSKLRIAKIMSNWFYDEVFPSIMTTGGYQLPNVVPQIQYVQLPPQIVYVQRPKDNDPERQARRSRGGKETQRRIRKAFAENKQFKIENAELKLEIAELQLRLLSLNLNDEE